MSKKSGRLSQSRLSRLERGLIDSPDDLARVQKALDLIAAERGGWDAVEAQYRPNWRAENAAAGRRRARARKT